MTSNKNKTILILKRFYIPWVALYVFIVLAAVVFGATAYNEYNETKIPPGYVELKSNKSHYEPGDPIEFTVTNHFPVPVYVINECPKEPLNVYKWQGDEWIQIHDTADTKSECYEQERSVSISPEGARSYNFSDWPNLFENPGVYRIAMAIEHSGDIPFADFIVTEPATVTTVESPQESEDETIPEQTVAPTPEPTIFFEEDHELESEEDEHEEFWHNSNEHDYEGDDD